MMGDGVGSRWDLGLGRLSELHHRIKGFLGDPWRVKAAAATGPGPSATPQTSPTPPSKNRQRRSSYKRTIFPQNTFRYQEYVGPDIKDVVPDFLVQELEEFEDAALDALELEQERIQQWREIMHQEDQKEQVRGEEEEEEEKEEEAAVVIYPMSEWDPEIARLEELMGVWNGEALLRNRRDAGSHGGGEEFMQTEEEESNDTAVEEMEEDEELILGRQKERFESKDLARSDRDRLLDGCDMAVEPGSDRLLADTVILLFPRLQ
ncbi:hypothetical protein BGX24_010995 [Mortierella sp. AD032]|nr:hypothetical protein BGX24_010995 [Mortierella sp. AD032]